MSELKTRADQPVAYTWDLTSMYADDAAWEVALGEAEVAVTELAKLPGTLHQSAETLADAIEAILAVSIQVERVYTYAHLMYDQDSTNSHSQVMNGRALQLYSAFSQAVAFFDPELLAIDEAVLASYMEDARLQDYRHYVDNITRARAHTLSDKEEMILAQMGELFKAPYQTFSLLDNADFVFPTIKDENGKDVQITHSVYGRLLESVNRDVRRETFQQYYSIFNQFKNSLAHVLATNVKGDNIKARIRGYQSARAAALAVNNVPESVYDTLLETVGEHLPLLHRYTALREKLLGIEKLEMYDLYTPLLGEAPLKFTYDQTKEIVLAALAPMGEEYLEIMEKAYDERWMDWFENKGKRSGAYSSGMYDSKPYILLNWQDDLNWLYTLVHELGHSAHSYLTHKYQPYVYGHYSIFLAEIASTTNENLLTSYLLEQYTDPAARLYILNRFLDGLKGTMFRQTQFAEFEHFIHVAEAEGQPLTHEFLSDHYKALNAKYYGPSVNSESEIALEWARIPHFYYNYYVFQYATGFAAATYFADKIVSGDKEALERYLGFLKSGASEYPIDTMKRAGLDMTQRGYIAAALKVFETRLDEFEKLVAEQ